MIVSSWRLGSIEAITKTLASLPPDADDKAKRKAISDAYPFGPRQYHPYKIWLSEVKKYFAPPKNRRATPSDIRRIEEYERVTGKKFPQQSNH